MAGRNTQCVQIDDEPPAEDGQHGEGRQQHEGESHDRLARVPGFVPAAPVEALHEHRHEDRGQDPSEREVVHHVRSGVRHIERVGQPALGHAQGVGHREEAKEAGQAGETGSHGHDRGVADERPARLPRSYFLGRGRNLLPHQIARNSAAPIVTNNATRL